MELTPYTSRFFEDIRPGSRKSAQEIVPLVLDVIPCQSVVDVGCGECAWLRVFKEHGVPTVVGFDGDYVNRDTLEIDSKDFHAMDLSSPTDWNQSFDLAVSLEVAEHLPESAADRFVAFLVSLAPVVLFSAAVPGQGGTNHVNEQWPDYWGARFHHHGFSTLDFIRGAIWRNENVERWYAQNLLLFVRADILSARPDLKDYAAQTDAARLSVVHPKTLDVVRQEMQKLQNELQTLAPENLCVRELIALLPNAIRKGIKRRIKV